MLSPFLPVTPLSPSIRTSSGVFEPFSTNSSTSGSPMKSSPTITRSRSSSMSQNSSRTFLHYREPTVLEKPYAVDEIRNALAEKDVSKLAELVKVHGLPPSLRPAAWPLLLKGHPLVLKAEESYGKIGEESKLPPVAEKDLPLKRIRGDIRRLHRIGGIGPLEEREIYETVVNFLQKYASIIPYESPMVWIAEFLLNGEHVSPQESLPSPSSSSSSHHVASHHSLAHLGSGNHSGTHSASSSQGSSSQGSSSRHSYSSCDCSDAQHTPRQRPLDSSQLSQDLESEHNTFSSREATPTAQTVQAESETRYRATPAERLETLRLSTTNLGDLSHERDDNADNTITENTAAAPFQLAELTRAQYEAESAIEDALEDSAQSINGGVLGGSPESSVASSPLATPPPLSAPGLVSSARRGFSGLSTSSVSSADSENYIVSFAGVNTGALKETFTQIMLFMHAMPPQYSEFVTLLRTYLPQVGQHFAREGVLGASGGDDWLAWWLRWLGIRAFRPDMLARLWDTYFSMHDPAQSVMKQHMFNCIVLMRGNRASLAELDQSECRQFLLHLPPCKDVEALIVEGKALAKTDPS